MRLHGVILGWAIDQDSYSVTINTDEILVYLLYWDRIDWPYMGLYGQILAMVNPRLIRMIEESSLARGLIISDDQRADMYGKIFYAPPIEHNRAVVLGTHPKLDLLLDEGILSHSIADEEGFLDHGHTIVELYKRYQHGRIRLLNDHNTRKDELWSLGQCDSKLKIDC